MSSASLQKLNTFSLFTIAIVALTLALIYTKTVVLPLFFAYFIYETLKPMVSFFVSKCRLNKALATLLTFLFFIGALAIIVLLASSSIKDFIRGADVYRANFIAFTERALTWLSSQGIDFDRQTAIQEVSELPVFSYAKELTGGVVSVFSNIALVLVYLGFMFAGETRKQNEYPLLDEIHHKIFNYVTTKLITSLVTSVLVAITLIIFDVDLILLLGVLTFVLNFIPSIGSVLATLVLVPVLLLKFAFGPTTIIVLIICGGIQFLIGNILEPKFMGDSMDLHPITIMAFLLFWGLVFGVPGMFLAVPITAILKILFKQYIQPIIKG